MRASRPAFLLGLILFLIGGWLTLVYLDDPRTGPVGERPDQPSTGSTRHEPVSELRWRKGIGQRYDVRVDSSFRMNMTGDAMQTMQVQLSGVLETLTLEPGPPRAVVGMRLSAAALRVGGQTDRQTNLALASPFRVAFSSAGMPGTFEFPAGVSAENREILENLIRMFQVTIRNDEAWVARETNNSGVYEAAYRRISPTQVDKSKRRFIEAWLLAGAGGAEITSTESIVTDEGNDWITAMTVDELMQTQGPAARTASRATLNLRPSAATQASPDLWRFAATPVPARVSQRQEAMSALPPEAAREQLQSELFALDSAEADRITLVHRLRDLLLAQETLPAILLDLIRKGQFSDQTRAQVFLALELAGTASAQAALRSVLADASWPAADSLRAIIALGGVANPEQENIEMLWVSALDPGSNREARQLSGTATLALGSAGSRLRASENPNYLTLTTDLLNGAISDTDPRRRASYILAIGNTGDDALASEVASFLGDQEPRVRRAAAQTLGNLGSNAYVGELWRQFEQESDSTVRGAIAEALASWESPPTRTLESVRHTIIQETDENTRFHMARLLATNLADSPENKVVLQGLLRTEQSKRIRQYVGEALASAN